MKNGEKEMNFYYFRDFVCSDLFSTIWGKRFFLFGAQTRRSSVLLKVMSLVSGRARGFISPWFELVKFTTFANS